MKQQHSSSDAIQTTAADWYARELGGRLNDDDKAALQSWLQEDPAHQLAYSQCENIWLMTKTLEDSSVVGDELEAMARLESPAMPAGSPGFARAYWPIFARAAAVITVGIGIFLSIQQLGEERYSTAIGEQRLVRLDDGSQILLNTQTRVRVDYAPEERSIYLDNGEAFFSVAKDATRPFIVNVDGSQLQALGTAFNVDLSKQDIAVVVTEGVVEVSTRTDADTLQTVAQLQVGQGARYQADHHQVTPKVANLEKVTAWQSRKMYFDNELLADAIAEHNRYTGQQIVLADEQLGTQHISGVFNIGDTESLVFALKQSFNADVRQDDDRILIE